MSEIVTTTGRRMSKALEAALDGCPDRLLTLSALEELASAPGRLTSLYASLALELRLCQLREQDTLQNMSRGLEAGEEPALPEATGGTVFFDPETGEFSDHGPEMRPGDE